MFSTPDALVMSYERLMRARANELQVFLRSEIIIIDECIFLTHFLLIRQKAQF